MLSFIAILVWVVFLLWLVIRIERERAAEVVEKHSTELAEKIRNSKWFNLI